MYINRTRRGNPEKNGKIENKQEQETDNKFKVLVIHI